MNINNDNYEEYFLLYADNELTAAQRQIVEMFVKANPHLQKEWNELMATVQKPENISFTDKSSLLKRPADAFIDKFNYDKRFVEYHDEELNEDEKLFVQDFLKEQPSFQKEFNLIGQAYLSPDNGVVFSDKNTLYRQSAVVRYGLFIRLAAAAIFIGFIFWIAFQMNGNENPQKAIVQNDTPVYTPEIHKPEQKQDIKQPILAGNKKERAPEKNIAAYAQSKVTEQTAPIRLPENANAQPEENAAHQERTEIAAMIPVVSSDATIDGSKTAIISEVPGIPASPHSIAANQIEQVSPEKTLVSFSQEPQENNYVFTDIPAENIQRSKLGIFIKKVKRTIDRSNPINRLFNSEEE